MVDIKPFIVYQNLLKMNKRISHLEKRIQRIENDKISKFNYISIAYAFFTWLTIYYIMNK